MEKCAFCDNETQLYYNGVPVCLTCEKERYPGKTSQPAYQNPPPKPNSREKP
jgi:hypothetical protein